MTFPISMLEHPAAIVGTTGAGKTFAAKGAVEELIRSERSTIILDPTGAWWGLRAGATPDQVGLPVIIFGGDHADVPVTPTKEVGVSLGEMLANREKLYAIIDTSEMTGGEKVRFLTPFLEALYAKNRNVLHLVVDEADEVAAQRIADGEQRLFGIFDKIVRRGRIKGFRPIMITQRPAVIHKNVLSQIGTLIALKLTSPQDRKAIEEWVKGNADADQARDVMKSLPTLNRGEGWIWSPADGVLERHTFPAITTFDSSRTPQPGDPVTVPVLAPIDVDALRLALSTPAAAVAPAVRSDESDLVEQAEHRGYSRGFAAGREQGIRDGFGLGIIAARRAVEGVSYTPDAGSPSGKATDFESVTAGSNPAPATKPSSSAKPARNRGTDPLLATALQIWPAKMTWAGLASMCGRKARGGHFNNIRKQLIDGGFVREEGGLVVPTDPPVSPAGVIPADLLEQNLPQPAAKMFAAIRLHPGIKPVDLAAHLGMQPRGGHWNNGMSILRRNGLIIETDGLLIESSLLGS